MTNKLDINSLLFPFSRTTSLDPSLHKNKYKLNCSFLKKKMLLVFHARHQQSLAMLQFALLNMLNTKWKRETDRRRGERRDRWETWERGEWEERQGTERKQHRDNNKKTYKQYATSWKTNIFFSAPTHQEVINHGHQLKRQVTSGLPLIINELHKINASMTSNNSPAACSQVAGKILPYFQCVEDLKGP